MEGDKVLAERYRKRAVEVRVIAAATMNQHHRKVLNEVADDYDQMARAMDDLANNGIKRGLPFAT